MSIWSGKTATARMLSCLIAPTSGTAIVNGYRVGKEAHYIRRTVELLTEAPGLYDRLSMEQNLCIYASLYKVRNPTGQVEKYLI
ncbi:MAG: hypothetical protein ACUVR2_08660 [Anaerolineae bacterium]